MPRLLATLKHRWRSAITGKFVSKLYAILHPDTTIEEIVHNTEKRP